jgi:hypothetical protein
MRLVSLVLVLAACGEVRQSHRWPDHRRERDEQYTSLAEQTQALEARAASAEARIKQLEQTLAKLQSALPSPAGEP